MNNCILIPVHNEAAMIGNLVAQLKAQNLPVVVVDDGSLDESGLIAQKNGAYVIRHESKKGKGQALQTGFAYLRQQNFDNVVIMDGDGQHAVEDLPKFFASAQQFPNSIIAGSRMNNPKGMPWVRYWTNRFTSALISRVCQQSIPDTQCGFRLISLAILRQIQLTSSDYEIESEILIKAAKKGFRIYSIPIKTIYRNEASKINPLLDTYRFFAYLIRELWTSKIR